MSDYVLDASVAVKWLLPPTADEPLLAEAMQLLRAFESNRIRFIVPDLFWPEVGNVLWKAVQRGRLTRELAEEGIRRAGGTRIPTIPSQPLLKDAFAIAAAHLRTVYDSLYVALAAGTRMPLVTADERLVNALAARFPVRWLGGL